MEEKQDALVSVIMPVYNAEKTLEASAASVLSQSYPNLELILVNDGSKDNSLALCNRLAEQDPRVRVLSQANAGAGGARNAALKVMRGQFVMFADADDRLPPDACRMMLDAIGENELVIAHYYFDFGSSSTVRGLLEGNRSIDEAEFMRELARKPGAFYYCALWNKLYRADLIRDMQLQFDPFYTWGEDCVFNLRYDRGIKNGVALLDQPVYHYVKTAESTSIRSLIHVIRSAKIKWRLYQEIRSLYREKGLLEQYSAQLRRYMWSVTLAD